ncbi:uncharacterized protein LOC134436008 [Engraulis encrasicolus]|uniref:uncharacterized protein LOC134436008 n=1 Tax=Engraulis encrasicolus TaxID=184585 RepID=UPI002FD37BCF
MHGVKEKVEFLNKKIEERKADKKQQANQDDLQDIAEAQEKLLHNRAEERFTAHLKSSDLEMDNLKDELEKLKTELNLKNQQVELLTKKLEENKADKKQQANQDGYQDYKDIAEAQQRLLQERAEEVSGIHELMNHNVDRLQSAEEKLVLADKKLLAALSKAEALEKELMQTRKDASQQRRCLNELKDKDLQVCELQDCVKKLKQQKNFAEELLDDKKRHHRISMDAINGKVAFSRSLRDCVELLTKKLEENKADKKQQANQDGLLDYKDIAEAQQRLLQERAEEVSGIHELMNHNVARLQSAEEKLVLADKKLLAALSKAEALEKEFMQTQKEASQQRSKYHDQIYKLRDKLSDTKDQQKRAIEWRDDQIKDLQRQASFLTRKLEKLTETTEMMDKVNTELLREKRQFYRNLNGDFLV